MSVVTGTGTIAGYVYGCFLDPQFEFEDKEDFLEYFLHSTTLSLTVYRIIKQISPLDRLDIALDTGITEVSLKDIDHLNVLGFELKRSASSVIIVNHRQFKNLSDATDIMYFSNPTLNGNFCDCLIISLDQDISSQELENISKEIQNELSYYTENRMGGYNKGIEKIKSALYSQNILYFEICEP